MICTVRDSRVGAGYDVVSLDHSKVFFSDVKTRINSDALAKHINLKARQAEIDRLSIIADEEEREAKNGRYKHIPIGDLIEAKNNKNKAKTRFEGSQYAKALAEKYGVSVSTVNNKLRGL